MIGSSLLFLLGIGLTKFSMDSHRLPKVQQAIANTDYAEARRAADHMLALKRVSDVAAFLGAGKEEL